MSFILYLLAIFSLSLSSVIYFNSLFHNVTACFILAFMLINNPVKFSNFNINTIVALLTFVITLPLILSAVSGLPLLSSTTSQREFFNNQNWILEGIFILLLQTSIFYLFSVKIKQFSLSDILKSGARQEKQEGIGIAISMSLMVISSYWSNQTGTIFNGNYGADDFYSAKGWFGGWPIILCISTAYYVLKTGLISKLQNLFLFIIVLYWLLHGNRSEVIIIAILPLYFYIFNKNRDRIKLNKKRLFSSIFTGFVILSLFQFIGFYRNASSIEDAFTASEEVSESRSLSISTIGPSAYTIVATIGLVRTEELSFTYGKDYLTYLYRTFPSSWKLFPEVEDFSDYLIQRVDAIGGAHIATEAYVTFGAFGVAIVTALLSALFCYMGIKARQNDLLQLFFVGLILYAPRVIWYGNIYLYKYMLISFFSLILITFLRKASR